MTWKDQYACIIWEGVKDLPDGMPLKDRIKVVDKLRPAHVSATSHGQKSWQAARREYLQRFGYEKPHIRKIKTPLEQLINEATHG